MKSILSFLWLFVFATTSFCQTDAPMAQSTAKPEAKAGAEQTATLVFYRPKRFVGSGLTPSVYLNGEEVARLDNGRYFVLAAKPGTLKLSSSMKQDPLVNEAGAGKVQYFEMVILTGNWRGGGRLVPTGAADANEALKKLKPLDQKWAKSDQVSFVLPNQATAETK